MTRRARFVACVVAVMWLLAPAPARAQATERIVSFDVEVIIQNDASLRVTERIRYDFGPSPRHGIFRDIPVRFPYEPDPKYDRITQIDDISVRGGPGTPDQVDIQGAGQYKRLKIGDPNREITGTHDYAISYRVRGALNAFPDHDELFWNASGNDWQVPIDAVTATVRSPGRITQVACYTGPSGSRLPCATSGTDGVAATFSQRDLSSYEGVTVVVALPKGTVVEPKPILRERWTPARAFAATPGSVGLTLVLSAAILAVLWRLLGRGRDRRWAGSPVDVAFGNVGGREEPVPLLGRSHDPVEFEPPDKIRPGEVGTLVDEVANPLDVTATIVDLAVRGYLRIEEIPKKGWFGRTDWRLIKLKDGDDLVRYERLLLNGLFREDDTVELSDLKRTFAERLHEVQDALYDDVVKAGWFPDRPDRTRLRWRLLGAAAVVFAFVIAIVLALTTHLGLVGIPLIVGGLVLLGGAGRMPRRTAKGYAALRRVNGFRQFIEHSEKERARFAERANLFSEYLPYAVVFGATEKWARAFEGLDAQLAQSTSWYVSSHPFAIGSFSDSMDHFAVTTSGTIVATAASASSGSSGFSGGGSSGGGFGGGGGGSW